MVVLVPCKDKEEPIKIDLAQNLMQPIHRPNDAPDEIYIYTDH